MYNQSVTLHSTYITSTTHLDHIAEGTSINTHIHISYYHFHTARRRPIDNRPNKESSSERQDLTHRQWPGPTTNTMSLSPEATVQRKRERTSFASNDAHICTLNTQQQKVTHSSIHVNYMYASKSVVVDYHSIHIRKCNSETIFATLPPSTFRCKTPTP